MTGILFLLACTGPIDAEAARGWALRHDGTLTASSAQLDRLLAALPSLPGDRFFCRETVTPPAFEGDPEALEEMLCRQQRPAWDTERYATEEELGTAQLNSAFLQFGVVGVGLTIAGPEGAVEWSDQRGVWQFADPEGVRADASGVTLALPSPIAGQTVDGKLGWGRVDTSTSEAGATRQMEPAFEWTTTARRREATATIRLFVLAEGTPDVDFVREALDRSEPDAP